MALSENDIPRLRALMAQMVRTCVCQEDGCGTLTSALCAQVKRGASAKVIGAQLLKAIKGEYSAKSYKERDEKSPTFVSFLAAPNFSVSCKKSLVAVQRGRLTVLLNARGL